MIPLPPNPPPARDIIRDDSLWSVLCTPQFCYDHCVSLGAPLMATQWSIECWCAEEVEVDFDRHGEAECDHRCAGDKV